VATKETMIEEAEDMAADVSVAPKLKPIPVDPDIKTGQLANGLKYIIRKNTKPENRVELRLTLNAGAIQEDDDQQGLAHFVEHMAFNGSEHFKKSELVDFLESIGTKFGPDLNAYTSFDETVYMLQVRTDSAALLDKGLLVLEDWAGGLSFDDEEIDKERGVVESEWRSRLSANQRMFNEYLPSQYFGSRYAERLPIGKPEIIRTAAYDVVKRFYKDWYRPDLMGVIIVGDIDVNQMEKEIKTRFGKLTNPDNPREREYYDVPKHKETFVSIVTDKEAPFTNVQLMYKHDHMPIKTMNEYRQSIVHRLYNNMLGARLNELAQSASPPFNWAFTGYSRDLGDIDAYSSYAMVAEGGARKGLSVLLDENERVLRHGFTEGELERQKTEILHNMERAFKELDKTDSRRFASRYVAHFVDGIAIPGIEDEVSFYKLYLPTIQLAEIDALAEKWITFENRVVVITAPDKPGTPIPTEDDIFALLENVSKKDIKPYVDNVSDAPLMAEMPTAAPIKEERKLDNIGVTELTLANGLKVVLKPTDFKNDEILVSGYSPGGSSLYEDKDYSNASNAARIVDNSGIATFDQSQLQKKMTGKTLRISPYISELYEGFNGSASPDDIETLLQMVHLFFTQPRKDESALQSYIAKQRSVYKNLMSNPEYWFSDQVSKISFKNHPRRGFPTEDQLELIDLDRVFEIYTERFADASDFTFLFVGNFDVETLKPLLATYLGSLPALNRTESFKDVGADYFPSKITKALSRGEAPKSLVNIIYHGDFEWDAVNRYNFNSMLDVLRIKMRESMREDKGGVYGVRVSGDVSQYPSSEYSITISFNADPPMMEELIKTAKADLKYARKNGADEKDLVKVRETQRQGRIKDLKENRFWSRSLRYAYQNGADPAGIQFEDYEKYVNGLSSEDIKNSVNLYFDENNVIQVTMTPEEAKEN
ncbi:MAG: zinc protease, partial [Saprospiraceae bacterium]